MFPLAIAHAISPISDVTASNRLRSIVETGGYDVVHLNSTKAGILGVPWRRRPRARTVFTPHALRSHAYPERSVRRRIALFIEKRICDAVDIIAACSHEEAERVVESGLAGDGRIAVIENGVTLAPFLEPPALSRSDIGVPEGAFLVGTVGRLAPQKDPETFVQACALVAARDAGAHFLIAGDGPLEATVKQLVTELGVDGRFHILGWRNDVAEVMKLLDVFVATSRYEGGPFAVLEAAAARKPIVACDSPGIRSLIADGTNGVLVPVGQPASVADAVLKLGKDEKMAQRLAAGAFEQIASPRRLEVMVDAWGALYRSLAEEPSAARAARSAQRYPA